MSNFPFKEEEQRLLEQLPDSLPVNSSSRQYRWALFSVLLCLLFIPGMYLCLLSVGASLLIKYVQHLPALLASGSLLWQVCFPLPILVGLVFLFFLVKPFFSSHGESSEGLPLERNKYPFLYAFVDKMAVAMKANPPLVIYLHSTPNAFASYEGNFFRVWKKKYTLTLGIPLLATFDITQLAGIIGHEIGHFAQQAGLSLSASIRYLNYWLLKIAYERDRWDQRIDQFATHPFFFVSFPFLLARLMLALIRGFFAILSYISLFLSSNMMREMEYDADLFEANLVGTAVFEKNLVELRVLQEAYQKTITDVRSAREEGRLPEDFSTILHQNYLLMTDDFREEAQLELSKGKTHWFDQHPADIDRLRQVEASKPVAAFSSDVPALIFLQGKKEELLQLSHVFYETLLGKDYQQDIDGFESLEKTMERKQQLEEEELALLRFFQGVFVDIRPIFPQPIRKSDDSPQTLFESYQQKRNDWLSRLPFLQKKADELDDMEEEVEETIETLVLLRAGCLTSNTNFESEEECEEHLALLFRKQERIQKEIASFDFMILDGLSALMAMLFAPQYQTDVPQAKRKAEKAKELLACLEKIKPIIIQLVDMRRDSFALEIIGSQSDFDLQQRRLQQEEELLLQELQTSLGNFIPTLKDTFFPFSEKKNTPSLLEVFLPNIQQELDFEEQIEQSMNFVERFHAFYLRCLAQVILIAEEIEASMGSGKQEKQRNKPNHVDFT